MLGASLEQRQPCAKLVLAIVQTNDANPCPMCQRFDKSAGHYGAPEGREHQECSASSSLAVRCSRGFRLPHNHWL